MFNTFQTISRIVYGNGAISQLGNEVKRLGGNKVVLVIDKWLEINNMHKKITEILNK